MTIDDSFAKVKVIEDKLVDLLDRFLLWKPSLICVSMLELNKQKFELLIMGNLPLF